ncbi:MAG: hypothetical protein RR868_03220, partial [Muribaculaceae bacterium]
MPNDDFDDYFDGPDIEEKPIEKPVEDPLSPKLDVDEDTMVVEKRPLHKIMIWTAIIAIIA